MADFHIAHSEVMEYEGYYSDDPVDRGGETFMGISRRFHSDWSGWYIIDSLKHKKDFPDNLKHNELLRLSVKELYKKNYWNRFMGDYVMSQEIANKLYDMSINIGVLRTIGSLQRALNLLNRNQNDYSNIIEDGIFGRITLNTLNSHPNNNKYILTILNTLQASHYIELSELSESQEIFLRGWLNRVSYEL